MPVDQEKAIVQNEGVQFEIIPEGIYTVQVVDIDLKENVESKYGVKDKFYFKLGILDEEYRAKTLNHFTSTAYTAGFEGGSASKLYETACSIMGEKLDDTLPLDVNTLIGGRFRIVIKHHIKDGKTYSNVTEVMKADTSGKKLPELAENEVIVPEPLDPDKISEELGLPDLD